MIKIIKNNHIFADKMNNLNNFTNNYKYISKLDRGSYGSVTKIEEKGSGKRFAMKKIDFSEFDNLNELDFLTRFSHPNIIQLKEYFFVKNNLNLIFPLGDCNLEKYVQNSTIHLQEKIDIMWKILSAVNFIHSVDYTHNDIKPENICMFGEEPVIIDFGLALPDGVDQEFSGTPFYTSPQGLMKDYFERHGFKKDDNRKIFYEKTNFIQTDIFSLGCVFYYILSEGQYLIPKNTEQNLVYDYVDFIKEFDERFHKIAILLKSKHYIKLFKDYLHKDQGEFDEKLSKTYFMIDQFIDLLRKMTAPSQKDRLKKIEEVMDHPFFQEDKHPIISGRMEKVVCYHDVDDEALNLLMSYKNTFNTKTLSFAYSIYLRNIDKDLKMDKKDFLKYCLYLANTLSEFKIEYHTLHRFFFKDSEMIDHFANLVKIVNSLNGQIRCSNEVKFTYL